MSGGLIKPEEWREFLNVIVKILRPDVLRKKKVFILGSYRPECKQLLEDVKNFINNELSHCYAFLMIDIPISENLVRKFLFLSHWADKVFLILEHDIGGHIFELGILTVIDTFREKTTILIKENALEKVSAMIKDAVKLHRNYKFRNIEELKKYITEELSIN